MPDFIAQDREQVFVCADCGRAIYVGDFYLEMQHDQVCDLCSGKHFKYAVKVDETD